jgi:hypothetical protein
MKRGFLISVLLISLVVHGCAFYEMGRILGDVIAFPVDTAWDITTGILDGFFFGPYESYDDDYYYDDSYDYDDESSDSSTPEPEEEKTYYRDRYGNIIY